MSAKPVKWESWRQNNPADQMVAVISAVRGYASNLAEGIYDLEKCEEVYSKLDDLSQQLLELIKFLPPTEWPKE